jgi:hypothetical protein
MSRAKLNNRDEIGFVMYGSSSTIKRPILRNMSIIGASGVANESISAGVLILKKPVGGSESPMGSFIFTSSDEATVDLSSWASLTLQEGDVLRASVLTGDAGSGVTLVLKIN